MSNSRHNTLDRQGVQQAGEGERGLIDQEVWDVPDMVKSEPLIAVGRQQRRFARQRFVPTAPARAW